MLIHVINGEQSLARIDHVTSTCALVVGQSPSVRPWQKSLRDLCHWPDHSPSKIDPGASSLLQATLFILSRLKENKLPSFSHRLLLKELQLICGDSWCVIFPRFLNWVSSTMAASKPKRSVKQPLNPDFVYDFPVMVFPSDFDPNATPSAVAQSAAQVPATTPNSAQKHSKQHKTKCQLMHVVNLCTTSRKKKSLRRSWMNWPHRRERSRFS